MADIDDKNMPPTEPAGTSEAATAVVVATASESPALSNGDMNHDADSTTSGDPPAAGGGDNQISTTEISSSNLSPAIPDSPPTDDIVDRRPDDAGKKEVDAHIPTLDTVAEEDNDDEDVAVDNDNDVNSTTASGRRSGASADADAEEEDVRSKDDCEVLDNDDEQLSKDGDSDDKDSQPMHAAENEEDQSQTSSDDVSMAPNPIESVDIPEDDDDPMGDNDDSTSAEDNEVLFIPPAEQVVHDISDSDDEPSNRPDVEHMEVDGGKTTVSNGVVKSEPNSDAAKVSPMNNGVIKSTHVAPDDDDDDDDDCVVIEDDEDPVDVTPRRNGRSRKSVLKPLRDYEEDIETITGDPLSSPPAKKHKPASSGLTIQNARSLAVDPLASSKLIMSRSNAETVQALHNQNISILPVSGARNTQHPYPMPSTRASITPVVSPKPAHGPPAVQHPSPQTKIQHLPPSPMATIIPIMAPVLPALTDDMFVLEAPSFIVPYIYEKPPADNLRDIVETIRKELAEQKKQEDVDVAEQEAKELEALSKEQRKLAELAKVADANKKKSSKKRPTDNDDDDSWGESDTSTDDETSDTEQKTKVLIKEADNDINAISTHMQTNGTIAAGTAHNPDNYFESPLGKFFMDIAVNLVQEHVQTDLLRQQKKRLRREGESAGPSVEMAIKSLTKNLEHSKSKNKMFKFQNKRCEFCNFKSESALAMAHHYEAPHLNGQMYRCNFCPFEARPPYDILFHMEAMHNVKARLEKALTYHQCPNCPFEDNGKSKLARHAVVCAKKFRPETNLNPPVDWEPPAKIPRLKPRHGLVGTATAYQAMAAQAQRATPIVVQRSNPPVPGRGRGRPATVNYNSPTNVARNNITPPAIMASVRQNLPVMNLQNPTFTMNAAGHIVHAPGPKSSKIVPTSISITPLPRPPPSNYVHSMNSLATITPHNMPPYTPQANGVHIKAGQPAPASGKSAFVICEVCDGHIKDLDQLRQHMQLIHEVKIHPKMIYNRPPLNCQKCQFRFFTDQGLERHLLGSHGLVTSSMQDAANKGKDSGRCPICGRFLQSKLLNHVSRDHAMILKPAHLSYKCTVCTATFGMYKQFENHVYSAHSNVAKKAMDGKSNKGASATSTPTASKQAANSKAAPAHDSVLKPFKINDEITIIPQPTQQRQTRGGAKGAGSGSTGDSHVIEIL